jgi:hypothetical protein
VVGRAAGAAGVPLRARGTLKFPVTIRRGAARVAGAQATVVVAYDYGLKVATRYLLRPTARVVLTVKARFLGRPWRP